MLTFFWVSFPLSYLFRKLDGISVYEEALTLDISHLGKYNIFRLWEIKTFMRILGLPLIEAFKKNHADVRGALDAWRKEAEQAVWHTTQDIKKRFPSADFLADNRVIFNIKGNSYRLVVKVRFQGGIVLVEWVGTHAEYDKKKF